MTWKTSVVDTSKWHRWWAWYPVQTSHLYQGTKWVNTWTWLEWVETRVEYFYMGSDWQYRPVA